ncbi:MAG: hypothetical protein ACYTG0_39560 [Planctomycetota bacterium]
MIHTIEKGGAPVASILIPAVGLATAAVAQTTFEDDRLQAEKPNDHLHIGKANLRRRTVRGP